MEFKEAFEDTEEWDECAKLPVCDRAGETLLLKGIVGGGGRVKSSLAVGIGGGKFWKLENEDPFPKDRGAPAYHEERLLAFALFPLGFGKSTPTLGSRRDSSKGASPPGEVPKPNENEELP